MSHPRVILYTRSHISSVINGCPAPILTPFLPSSKRKKIPSTKKTVAVRVQEYIIFTSDPISGAGNRVRQGLGGTGQRIDGGQINERRRRE